VLKKNANTLESYGIKDGSVLVFEQVERTPVVREKKPKEDAKLTIYYRVRGAEDLPTKLEVPTTCKAKLLKKLLIEELGVSG
jgi:hypothetical protein